MLGLGTFVPGNGCGTDGIPNDEVYTKAPKNRRCENWINTAQSPFFGESPRLFGKSPKGTGRGYAHCAQESVPLPQKNSVMCSWSHD